MRLLSGLFILLIGVAGCAVLQDAPIVELPASRLSCETNPGLVDGDMETISTFQVEGSIRKGYVHVGGAGGSRGNLQRQYRTEIDGTNRTQAVIKLDAPMYVAYVEVYPASRIPALALVTTTDEEPQLDVSFEAVYDKQHESVESMTPVKIQIGRKVLYLRLSADALEDQGRSVRNKETHQVNIPLKGASIREVKFYGRQ